jgi:hypothetical protein
VDGNGALRLGSLSKSERVVLRFARGYRPVIDDPGGCRWGRDVIAETAVVAVSGRARTYLSPSCGHLACAVAISDRVAG